jgi:hypothetical protein
MERGRRREVRIIPGIGPEKLRMVAPDSRGGMKCPTVLADRKDCAERDG